MRHLELWLEAYGESHKNATNKAIHWICVPLIMISIFGILYSLPFFAEKTWYSNWGAIAFVPVLFFYFRLSLRMFFAFVFIALLISWLNEGIYRALEASDTRMLIAHISIFIVAWIFQFIGHKIEGKKPSFLEDIQFLLIGPAWLMSFLFKKWNIPY
jgi:uncharacterized membrane protein YGL010W